MISPEAYFKEHQLYDKKRLQQHCEQNLVYMRESERFPTVVMLHYAEEAHFDQKWNQFNSMCRGLIVDMKNKRILAHPFNKFFNIDERPETKYSLLEKMGDFEVSEKLDGSLLILFKDPNTDKYFVTTKGSFDSEHGKYGNRSTRCTGHLLSLERVCLVVPSHDASRCLPAAALLRPGRPLLPPGTAPSRPRAGHAHHERKDLK